MKIAIYQIDPRKDVNMLLYRNLDTVERVTGGRKVDGSIYDMVWFGEVDCETLEDVYRMFNIDRPADFQGRSLSVSDVVEVFEQNGSSRFWFCDSIGFAEVELRKTVR